MQTIEITYNRTDVMMTIADQAGHPLRQLAHKYIEEAEMLRRVYDNASTNDGACRVGEAARGLAKLHTRDDDEFTTEVFLAIVFFTLRQKRQY
jgi:hypothetical protein